MRTISLISPVVFFVALLCIPVSTGAQCKKNGKCKITDVNGNVSEGKNRKGLKTGEWKTVTAGGVLLEIMNYKDGKRHGAYQLYHKNGIAYYSGFFKDNQQDSIWIERTIRGDTVKISTLKNDTLHGYFRHYESLGKKITEGFYERGKKEGVWVTTITRTWSFSIDSMWYHNDQLHGVWKKYDKGFLLRETHYKNGMREGPEITYHSKNNTLASITYYKEGKRDSVMLLYFDDGRKSRATWYTNGKQVLYDSIWTQGVKETRLDKVILYGDPDVKTYREEYDAQGRLTIKQYFGDDGVIDSTLRFHPNGRVSERQQYDQNAVVDYRRTNTYHQSFYGVNGKLWKYGNVLMNSREGTWVWVDSTGKKTKEIVYSSGSANGAYRSYYLNGKVKVLGFCRDGYLRDSIQVYSAGGTLLKKGTPAYKQVFDKQMLEEKDVRYLDPDAPPEFETDAIVETVEAMEVEAPQDEVFTFVEVMPKFPGDSLQSYLQHKLIYPSLEKELGKEGTVYIKFTIEKDGAISNVRVVKDVPGAPGLTKEAIRVFSAMPRWTPGLMNGRPVRVEMTMPVRFNLE